MADYIERFVFSLKLISGAVSAVALVGITVVSIAAVRLGPSIRPKRSGRSGDAKHIEPAVAQAWRALQERLKEGTDQDAATLIIEADTIVDKALKVLRLPGTTTGERMKSLSGPGFKSLNDLWEAHKIRNQIAHEGVKNIRYGDAVYALEKYEKALQELGML